MIKCTVKQGGYIQVKVKGKAHDLAVETAAMIEAIYEETKKTNPAAAQEYKNKTMIMLLNPDSPMWKKEEA